MLLDKNLNEHEIRLAKLDSLKNMGYKIYPNDFNRSHTLYEIIELYQDMSIEELDSININFKVAGRIFAVRRMGKIIFIKLRDFNNELQVILSQSILGELFDHWSKYIDIGDIIGVGGSIVKTKTGELSIKADYLQLLTKCLQPYPDKFHGVIDNELCYRQRYVDLIVNKTSFNRFKLRSKIIQYIREFFYNEGFLEFETPIMQNIPGGAIAKPFITKHNALNIDLYLRVSPELYLKRLVVGGFEKVFELNKSFRNEGISTRHNPEFTMLEFYEAYAEESKHRKMVEALIKKLISNFSNIEITKPFVSETFDNLLKKYTEGIKLDLNDPESLKECCIKYNIPCFDNYDIYDYKLKIFEEVVEHNLIEPCFVIDYPAKISPLSRRSDSDPNKVDRFELFINGVEIANGFSELNDPKIQAENFQKQLEARTSGDDEAMFYDADYIEALKYGLPPTAGTGIGIDRLIMFLTETKSIKDILLFPTLKPINKV